jgi:hypothetical protein
MHKYAVQGTIQSAVPGLLRCPANAPMTGADPPFCSVARPIGNLPVLGHNRVIFVRRLADIQVPLAPPGRTVLVMDPDPAGLVRSGCNMLSAVTTVTATPRPRVRRLGCGEPAPVSRRRSADPAGQAWSARLREVLSVCTPPRRAEEDRG